MASLIPLSAVVTPNECTTSAEADIELRNVEGGIAVKNNVSNDEILYDAAAIRSEFEHYRSMLPTPDKLLQQQHSVDILRDMIEQKCKRSNNNKSSIIMPRFLRHESEGGIKPHNVLCCLLLNDFEAGTATKDPLPILDVVGNCLSKWFIWVFSAGRLYPQLYLPADVIRDQFYRVATAADVLRTRDEATLIEPDVLRHKIRNQGLPIPNFFLDPEDPKQFPPHIALLVILQDGRKESHHLQNRLRRLAWLVFAIVALSLRFFLEVIGGAGAIWGGSEVFHLRKSTPTYNNNELWRWISIAVGIFCFLRFVTLNAPQQEDEGDILGPAGPWSLRTAARLRAVCDHPFHYFCRAQAPHPAMTSNSHKNRKEN